MRKVSMYVTMMLSLARAQALCTQRGLLTRMALGDFATIQDAISNASDGDTAHADSGTYSGPIVIDKSLTLQGENCERAR
jgi:nitrous oxidase accessory protein NosD